MDEVEGVPKTLIHWSVALLGGLFLFSLISFLRLRSSERHLERARTVFMDWDGVSSLAWAVTSTALVLVAILTYVRLHAYRWWDLTDMIQAFQQGGEGYYDIALKRHRETREALWYVGTAIASAGCVLVWMWAAGPRAKRRYRGPARHSGWLLVPIAVSAGLLLVIGLAYHRAFWTPVDPHFDTSIRLTLGASRWPDPRS